MEARGNGSIREGFGWKFESYTCKHLIQDFACDFYSHFYVVNEMLKLGFLTPPLVYYEL